MNEQHLTIESQPRRLANRPIPASRAEAAATRYTETEWGCWTTTYAVAPNGYASMTWRVGSRTFGTGVHRAAWTHHNGPIPDGMTVDHMCRNKLCVNPAHLRLLTNSDNARRTYGRDWELGVCSNGHPDSERRKVEWAGRSWRICQKCLEDKNRLATQMKTALYQLELAYGLGGHEEKHNYAYRIRLREARVAAQREQRIQEMAVAS